VSNLKAKQHIDRLLGPAICSVLTVLGRLRWKRAAPDPAPARYLVIKFWGMGSIILASSGIQELKKRYPGAHVTMLTLSRNFEIIRLLGIVDHVESLEVDRGLLVLAADVVRLMVHLWRRRVDIVIDLEFFTRFSAIVTWLIGAPVSGGFYDSAVWRGYLHTLEVPFNRRWHTRRNFENLIGHCAQLSLPEGLPLARPCIAAAARQAVAALLPAADSGKLIVINPNAGELAYERRWPAGHVTQLVAMLAQLPRTQVALIGTRDEAAFVTQMHTAVGRLTDAATLNLAGALTLEMLCALLERADYLITNDSGPLHLALALGVRTVSFFGPETPAMYGPPDDGRHVVFFKNLACSPCINVHNGKIVHCVRSSPECLETILPEEVRRALQERGLI
jgi:ADP-heptose:LPS heptosyltransferase